MALLSRVAAMERKQQENEAARENIRARLSDKDIEEIALEILARKKQGSRKG